MGRPINKRRIGFGEGRIQVTSYRFTSSAESQQAAIILRQRSTNRFTVTNGEVTQVLTLVNKAQGTLAHGEFILKAIDDAGETVNVTKLRNNTVQIEGGTGDVYNAKYVISDVSPAAPGIVHVDGQFA